MEPLKLAGKFSKRRPLRVLCLGAHCDDIEIGCGGALLRLTSEVPCAVTAVVASSTPDRAAELRRSIGAFCRSAEAVDVQAHGLPDGRLPAAWAEAKALFEAMKALPSPDLVFTHQLEDRHQDHRVVAELTWNTFRDHLVLEYEVPKYEGSAVLPNFYVPVTEKVARKKVSLLLKHYPTQRARSWFSADTFFGTLALRGLESRAPSGFAEGFTMRKGVL